MKIEVCNLTEDNLGDAPEWESHPYSCKYCLYWEHPELLASTVKREETFERKRKWLRRVRAEFGNCGKLLYLDLAGRAVGYAQYAPEGFLPNARNYPAGPVSPDAVLISCLFISGKDHQRRGLGSLLLRTILGDLRARRIKAVETFARRGNPENPAGPLEFYLRHGFVIFREDMEFPLMRLELGGGESNRGQG